MTTETATAAATLSVDRKTLLAALAQAGGVIAKHSYKPILEGVRLEALDGQLRLSATDLDFGLELRVQAQGGLPPCVVSCDELTRRLKAGKGQLCTLGLDATGEILAVNGGHPSPRPRRAPLRR